MSDGMSDNGGFIDCGIYDDDDASKGNMHVHDDLIEQIHKATRKPIKNLPQDPYQDHIMVHPMEIRTVYVLREVGQTVQAGDYILNGYRWERVEEGSGMEGTTVEPEVSVCYEARGMLDIPWVGFDPAQDIRKKFLPGDTDEEALTDAMAAEINSAVELELRGHKGESIEGPCVLLSRPIPLSDGPGVSSRGVGPVTPEVDIQVETTEIDPPTDPQHEIQHRSKIEDWWKEQAIDFEKLAKPKGTREDWDRTWAPYCCRCSTTERMRNTGVYQIAPDRNPVQTFQCRHCHARHHRLYPDEIDHATKGNNPRNTP